ncbi:hypothetical protein HK099_002214, partial [Clydaea vesicula]
MQKNSIKISKRGIKVYYFDEDKDLILINNDKDLEEAIVTCKNLNLDKINLKVENIGEDDSGSNDSNSTNVSGKKLLGLENNDINLVLGGTGLLV